MIKEELIRELNALFSSYLAEQNIDFVDLIYRHEGDKIILTVLVDRTEGGITLGECALINRRLIALLEEKNLIVANYVLEVSSPGLDRPLKTAKDFLRCLNKEAEFFLNDLVNGKCQWQGLISKVDENSVFIQSKGQSLEIGLDKINKARLVV